MRSRSNWNLEVLVFEERGKPDKNLSEQGREPTTNSTHIWRRRWDSNPGHIGGRRLLLPLRHPRRERDWGETPHTKLARVTLTRFLRYAKPVLRKKNRLFCSLKPLKTPQEMYKQAHGL